MYLTQTLDMMHDVISLKQSDISTRLTQPNWVAIVDGMAWVVRDYSKGRINQAGDDLIGLSAEDPRREESLLVIDNWRSCHAYPLQAIKMTLLGRSHRLEPNALIAQRLKRLPSIATKLRDNPQMKLSQMQDIGGCRVVFSRHNNVRRLANIYKADKGAAGRPLLVEEYDYINHPKADGYRSFHFVHKYRSKSSDKQVFDGQRIEIQIRSRLQHAWATSVEIVQAFTRQALKARIKRASSPEWLRFFALMGSAIAARESLPLVPGTPTTKAARKEELRMLNDQEKIVEQLRDWAATMRLLEKPRVRAHMYLLDLDPRGRTLSVTPFQRDQSAVAQESYLELERAAEGDPERQVVLVTVDSLDALRKAYPNYYVDSEVFIDAVHHEIV